MQHLGTVSHHAADIVGIARLLDAHLLHHLTDNDLDVFIVDIYALRPVNHLYLADQVFLHRQLAVHQQYLAGVGAAFGDHGALLDQLALMDAHLAAEYDLMLEVVAGLRVVHLYHIYALVVLIKGHQTAVMGDDGNTLGLARLKQLLDAGQTLRNVAGGGDTAGVEGSHGQLGTRLTDGLRRDDAHGFTDGDRTVVGKVRAVAAAASAVLGTAVDDAADLQAGNTGIHDLLGGLVGDHLLAACQQLAGVGVHHIFAGVTTG